MIKLALAFLAFGAVLPTANGQTTAESLSEDVRLSCQRNGSMWQLALQNAQSGEANLLDHSPFDLRSECQEALDRHGGSFRDGIFACVPNENQTGWYRSLIDMNRGAINVYQSKLFDTFESCAQDATKNVLWGQAIATCEANGGGAGIVRYAPDGQIISSELLRYPNVKDCQTALRYSGRIWNSSTFKICAQKSSGEWAAFNASEASEHESWEVGTYPSLEQCWLRIYDNTMDNANLQPKHILERTKLASVLKQCGDQYDRLGKVKVTFSESWLSSWYRKDSEASRAALCDHTLSGVDELLRNATIFANLSGMFGQEKTLEIDLPGSDIQTVNGRNLKVPDQWGSNAKVDEIIRKFSMRPAFETAEGFWAGASNGKVRDSNYCHNLPGSWRTPTIDQLIAPARRGDFEKAPRELGLTGNEYYGFNSQFDFGTVSLIGRYAGSFSRIPGDIMFFQANEYQICIKSARR